MAEPAISGTVVERRDATRERLLKAARELFVARGYHATRPQDISKLAGLGQGTFYLYFADKKACFIAFVVQARLELQHYVQARAFGVVGLEAFFTAQIGASLDFSAEHPGLLRAAMADVSTIATDVPDLTQTWAGEWARMVSNTIQRGVVDASYDPEIAGALLLGTIGGAVAAANRGAPRDKVIANTVRFLIRALQPQR